MKNKVDGLVGENEDIRKEVQRLKNEKMEQDKEHSYKVNLFKKLIHNFGIKVKLWRTDKSNKFFLFSFIMICFFEDKGKGV